MERIIQYKKSIDKKLIDLFYQSIFSGRDEIEYVKEPTWAARYNEYHEHIFILIDNDTPIASIGAIPWKVKIGNEKFNFAMIVDNCILPNFKDRRDEIFTKLYEKLFKQFSKNNIDVALCWEYEKSYKESISTYNRFGFEKIPDVNWSIAGIEYNKDSPKKWRGKNKFLNKTIYRVLKIHNMIKMGRKSKKIPGINVKISNESNVKQIADFLKSLKIDETLQTVYSEKDLQAFRSDIGLKSIIAEKNDRIVGVLNYFISPWTGMMYGKPTEGDWEKFYTLTIDELIVDPEYDKTNIPKLMLEKMIEHRWNHPSIKKELSGMIVDLVHKKDKRRKNIYDHFGFIQPAFDKGLLLVKKINPHTPIEKIQYWHIPNRYVIAPIPKEIQ